MKITETKSVHSFTTLTTMMSKRLCGGEKWNPTSQMNGLVKSIFSKCCICNVTVGREFSYPPLLPNYFNLLEMKIVGKEFSFCKYPTPSFNTFTFVLGGTFFKSSIFSFVDISHNHRRIWKESFSVWSLLIHFIQKLVSYSMQSLWQLSQYSEWLSL